MDGCGCVLKADIDDVVHRTHIEDDAGRDGGRAAHDAGAAAVGDDGDNCLCGGFQDFSDVLSGLGADDGEGECLVGDFPVACGDGVAGVVLKGLGVSEDVIAADDLVNFQEEVGGGHINRLTLRQAQGERGRRFGGWRRRWGGHQCRRFPAHSSVQGGASCRARCGSH